MIILNPIRFLFFFIITSTQIAIAQGQNEYYPSPVTDTIPEAIHTWLKVTLKAEKDSLKKEKFKISEFAKDIYEKQFEYTVKTFNKDHFITQGRLTEHINSISKKILDSNPSIPNSSLVLPYRSDEPNATSYGNGIIGLNLGLLVRTESDDQLAFIISHELAHVYFRHSQQQILKIASLNFDKEIRKKFQLAKSSQYNSYSKLKELMNSVELDLNRHSQQDELEADSVALIFMTRAGYNPIGSLRCMELLDSAEHAADRSIIELDKHFSSYSYPIKESWIKYSKSDTWHKSYERPDSAKTHPNCKLRRTIMRDMIYLAGIDTSKQLTQKNFIWKEFSWFELANSHFHMKEYGKSLYTSLLLLNKQPNNPFLQGMVAKSLFQIYVSQKKHELGKVVELPDSRYSENYDRILTFIHNLRLNEVGAIAYHYITSRPIQNLSNEHVLYALWLISFLDISALNPDSIKNDYLTKYPNGWYQDAMKASPQF